MSIPKHRTMAERASVVKALASDVLKANVPHHKVDYVAVVISRDDGTIFRICCSNTRSGDAYCHAYYLDVRWPDEKVEADALSKINRVLTVELPEKARRLERMTKAG